MRLRMVATTMLAAAISLGMAGGAYASDASQAFGVWANPKNSVHVEIKPCGASDHACGVVVWANEKAQLDAKKGGTDALVGLQLFRDMVRGANGVWAGRVFVPDLNRTFSGTAEAIGGK